MITVTQNATKAQRITMELNDRVQQAWNTKVAKSPATITLQLTYPSLQKRRRLSPITDEDLALLEKLQGIQESYEISHEFYKPMEKSLDIEKPGPGNTQPCRICRRKFSQADMILVNEGRDPKAPNAPENTFWLCDGCRKKEYQKMETTDSKKDGVEGLIQERDRLKALVAHPVPGQDLEAIAVKINHLELLIATRNTFQKPELMDRMGRIVA